VNHKQDGILGDVILNPRICPCGNAILIRNLLETIHDEVTR
jgi:hypothetical protein